jgi:hypothetical protein
MAKPVQSPFVRCDDARVMLGGRSILERCEHTGWFTPVRRGKRLTLFKRDDIEAAQLRVSWGELPELALFFLQFSSYVGSIGLPITNHFSPITSDGRASGPAAESPTSKCSD